jgi:hypothetical protein
MRRNKATNRRKDTAIVGEAAKLADARLAASIATMKVASMI